MPLTPIDRSKNGEDRKTTSLYDQQTIRSAFDSVESPRLLTRIEKFILDFFSPSGSINR